MRVLLFGANGQVGSACREHFRQAGITCIPMTRHQVDFAEPEQVYRSVLAHPADAVVNACAYTAVDKAEAEIDLATLINGDSVGAMGRACAELDLPIIHISTDYVFNGRSSTPYREDDPVEPMGVYGASKLAGERALSASGAKFMTLRTSWVFGEQGNNFVKTMLRLGLTRPQLGVVADQIGCPTYAGDIAWVITQCLLQLEQQGALPWGVYHCSSQGQCSWYDFAVEIFDQAVDAGLLPQRPEVKAITTAEYPTPAARPGYSVLDTGKLATLLGEPLPHWRQGLKSMLGDPALRLWLDTQQRLA